MPLLKTTLIILFCFLSSFIYAQDKLLDSLIEVQKKMPNDTNRANVLLSILKRGKEGNEAIIKPFALEAIALTQQLGWKKGQSRAFFRYGNLLYVNFKLTAALDNYKKAETLVAELNDISYLSDCYYNISNTYIKLGQNSAALDYLFKTLKIAEAQKDVFSQIENINKIAYTYYESGEFSKTISEAEKALALNKEVKNALFDINSLTHIGNAYLALKQFDEAIICYKKADEIIKINNLTDDVLQASTFLNIGVTYERKKDYQKSLEYAQKALKYALLSGNQDFISNAYLNVGSSYFFQKKYQLSIAPNQKSYAIAKKINNVFLQRESLRGLSDAYENLGEKAKAFDYLKQYEDIRDTLVNENQKKEITQKIVAFELEKQKMTDSLVQADNQKIQTLKLSRQQSYTIGCLIAFFLATLFGGSVWLGLRQTRKERAKSEALLLNILPEAVAEELKQTGKTKAKLFENVTVLMTDFVSFTQTSEELNAEELVLEIHTCFKAFDAITSKYGIEKIKTVGDAYVAVSGIPQANAYHVHQAVKAALEMRDFMIDYAEKNKNRISLKEVRIGLNTGSVVAGVVGSKKFAYDIWGDAVNVAARMEQNGLPQKVNVSETVHQFIANDFDCTPRGKITAKNKGEIEMFVVENLR
jgi:adenylate cyclase